MYRLKTLCLALLLSLSTSSNASIDPYYSQAWDIDYALAEEDGSIRHILERAIKKFLKLVKPDSYGDEEGVTFTPGDYFGNEDSSQE